MYRTPSAANWNTYSDNPGPRSDADQTTREFNDSVEFIFENIEGNGLNHQADSPSSLVKDPNARLSRKQLDDLFYLGRDLACDGNYRAAEQKFKLVSLGFAEFDWQNDWNTVGAGFVAALMRAADFPGCPQSIIARFTQKLSRFLMRETKVQSG